METRRWTNPSQPQTLQAAVFLLYISAVINVFFGAVIDPLVLIATIAGVAGGLGIASEKRWGYLLAAASAALRLLPVLLILLGDGIARIFDLGLILAAVYPVLLLVLLAHPQSREYERIWFN